MYISQLVQFARVCTKVFDFNDLNLNTTSHCLPQWYEYHRPLNSFTRFYKQYKNLVQTYVCKCKDWYEMNFTFRMKIQRKRYNWHKKHYFTTTLFIISDWHLLDVVADVTGYEQRFKQRLNVLSSYNEFVRCWFFKFYLKERKMVD